MKVITVGTWLGVALTLPAMANAAFFDFQQWIADNGEQGFDNSAPFTLSDAGLTLTAKAFENPGRVASHVYMDDLFNGNIGGMGVCTTLNLNSRCTPSSDDNVSIDGMQEEVLAWEFSINITELKLELGNSEHPAFVNSSFNYSLDNGSSWLTATTNGVGMVTLMLGGMNQVEFRAAGNALTDNFYIRNADATVVPVPAAVWLFGSGLLCIAGIARRKSA